MTRSGQHPTLISFVIPVRNDEARLRRCLATIAANRYPAYEVIVVDNGSKDESQAVAAAAGATVLHLPGPRVGELRNRGAEVARGEIIAFVDADHELDEAWMVVAVEVLDDPSVAIAGALCQAPADGTWVQQAYDALRARRPGQLEVEWLGSGNMAIRRRVFEECGGFDTSLETCEDVDLCRRVRQRGGRIVSDDRMKNVHAGDPATLEALFRGELWRGRDNLRVSLRSLTLRGLPSLLIPVMTLGLLVILVIGLFSAPFGGLWIPAAALAGIALFVLLRAARMISSRRVTTSIGLAQIVAVAAVYELARALALAARTGHGARADLRAPVDPSSV